MTSAHERHRWSRGQSAVEFAIVATAFFTLLAGVMMMGEAVLAYNGMSAAADEAVRYAVANGPNSPSPATTAQIQQIAYNVVPELHLSSSNVSVSWVTDTNMSSREDAVVVVSYNYPLKIPFMKSITLHLSATSQMMASE